MMGQLCGDCRIGQQTEILIAGLVRVERLVAFADAVPLALVFHDIAAKHGFMVVSGNARGENGVRRLDVPITGIHADNLDILFLNRVHKNLHKPS